MGFKFFQVGKEGDGIGYMSGGTDGGEAQLDFYIEHKLGAVWAVMVEVNNGFRGGIP